ncbi:TPA: penicillin-binding protein [Candidatus Ventrenecus avicola]|nr:penicillin-binding protein [Candidatus Ventrenecus avicola]
MKKAIKTGIFFGLSCVVLILGVYVYAFFSPRLELENMGKVFIYDHEENLIYQGSGSSEWISLSDISPDLKDAVVSVEDKNFYSHQGFDIPRIVKAFFSNIANNTRVGASTISQQYIKNMFLTFDQTWSRKIEEAFLTVQLEVHYDKDAILEGYLNTINYGEGNYGIEDASKYYFNKSSKDLTLEEAIMLAGIPKNPSNYNPVSDYDACIERAWIVADSMLKNGYITEEEYNELFQDKVEIYGQRTQNNSQMIMYYQDAVLDELEEIDSVPNSLIESGGLKIYTAFDMDAQTKMEENILKYMGNQEELQVASVMVNPSDGGVLALTGGLNYAKSQYNRATMSKRQVGSTMKPFLYYAALENGLVASSTFKSEKTTFNFSNDQLYSPSNYNNIYANKDITMAAAIAFSDNIYAVKTHLFLGTDVLVDTARRAGIKEEIAGNPSLALGTSELNMMDFATGYTTLANGGDKQELHFITRVEDLDGNVLYEFKQKHDYVFNSNDVYILNELLTSTTNSAYSDYTTPTALSLASKMSRKYALKTGTTNTDSWVAGYNPDVLMMVWVGNDDAEEIDSTASYYSKNIWLDTLESYLIDVEPRWYETPQNVIGLIRDGITGEQTTDSKNSTVFYYVKGTETEMVPVTKEED